ncbi:tubulin epsilon and delta complex protein 2 [Rhinophrynus dorsalis]
MLSAASSHRLLSLLNKAILNCKEEEKLLEDEVRHCRSLLGAWKMDESESLTQEEKRSETPDKEPPADELQEMEMLNKALEKALRVREKIKPEPHGVKAPTKSQKSQSCPPAKEKSPKPTSKTSKPIAKAATSQLNPPYKTNPEKRRVRGSVRLTSNAKAVLAACQGQQGTERGTEKTEGTNSGQAKAREDSSRAENTLRNPIPPPCTLPMTEKQEEREEQPFTLKHKGATLRLPLEYQREYTRSSRLWEKFYEIQNLPPAAPPPFLQMLQATFVPDSPRVSLSQLEEETMRLKSAVSSLYQRLDLILQCPDPGPPQWQNYRELLMLESLQEDVTKELSALHQLHIDAEQYRKWDEKHSTGATHIEPRVCPSYLRKGSPILVYSHPRELSELTRCRLRVLELKQKIGLLKVLSEELLAEAESRCHSAPESALLYRSIYTLLCEGGEHFPVLVHEDG